ncbi:RNA polymerase sigma factor [Candidatus Peregrinibacteria bacterium]|nr:RNA polymerase sigma factor [Candidatus Peregrinibacteria bacterium]
MDHTKFQHDRFIAHYHEHKDKLFNYLMVRLNYDRQQAEDLLMDVVLKAYEKFHTFDPEKGAFRTWIFTLTHNHLVNFWRSNKKSVSLDELDEKGIYPATAESGEQAGQQLETQKIHHILSLMKEGGKEIITLRYLQELDYGEIARITGKKEGAIRTGLSRALSRFTELYHKIYPSS